jgi:hypothetical protein
MATRTINTSGATNLDQATINTLKNEMVSGAIIRASHFNSLITLWNNFRNHTHTINDLYGIRDFGDGIGNTAGYSDAGSTETDTTSVATSNGSELAGVSVGTTITSTKHNEIRGAFASQLSHLHTWDDRIS